MVEQLIRADLDVGDFNSATTRFIQRFGGEILGFIVGRAGYAFRRREDGRSSS